LKVTLDGKVKTTQRAILMLSSTSAVTPVARSFVAPPLLSDNGSITFPTPGVPAGKYFVTVQVDGAPSPLDLDPASPTFGPTVKLP
jgi:hypothetical protein